jgi:hypothetical protein
MTTMSERGSKMPIQIAAVIRESVRAANEPLVEEIRQALVELRAAQGRKPHATK